MKTVLDTNVLLVSVSSKSPYYWIFKSMIKGLFTLCITYEILLEYQEKIEEHMGSEFAKALITVLLTSPFVIEVHHYFYFNLIASDQDDNKFSDCAVAANAYCIVTEDRDFDILKKIAFPKVTVLRIAEFKELLQVSEY